MQWYNMPKTWRFSGDVIAVEADPGTDFWRKTYYGFIRDTGHFYYTTVGGDFTATVKVTGSYRDLYDQAGLMVRSDETHWVKTGIEFVHGQQYISAVVTRDFSDWSVAPLPQDLSSIWLRLTRKAEAVEIQYALDGASYALLRVAYLPPCAEIDVGVMCAAPDGQGFPVLFEGFAVGAVAS